LAAAFYTRWNTQGLRSSPGGSAPLQAYAWTEAGPFWGSGGPSRTGHAPSRFRPPRLHSSHYHLPRPRSSPRSPLLLRDGRVFRHGLPSPTPSL
jgi:hypothetical protein